MIIRSSWARLSGVELNFSTFGFCNKEKLRRRWEGRNLTEDGVEYFVGGFYFTSTVVEFICV